MYIINTESSSESLAEANTQSSVQWQSLPDEEKQKYNDEAKAINACSSHETTYGVKRENKKILNHLQEVVSFNDAAHIHY